jgi:hypothetical protein
MVLMTFRKMMMMTTPEGVESTGGNFGSVSPIRSSPSSAYWLYVYVFLISTTVASMKTWGVIYIGHFRSNEVRGHEIEANRTDERAKRDLVARPRWGRATGHYSYLLTSWCPTLAHFVRLEISEAWPLTLPFFESRSSWKVKSTNKRCFLPDRVWTRGEGIV